VKTAEEKPDLSSSGVPLAIIGIGCLFPQADDANNYWAHIREGIDAITEIPPTHWRVDDYYDGDPKAADRTYGRRGGFLSPISFNPLEFNIPPNTLEAIDTSQLLGLVTAGQALRDAGYGPERDYDRDRVSVILGVTGTLELVIPLGARLGHPIWRQALKDAGVDDAVADDVVQRIADSYVPWQENSFPGLLGNVTAGRISKQYDLGGTNCVVDAACASSFSALHLASLELADGKADMVVTGGIDTFNDIFMYMCFSKTPALSPTGNAKPFDAAGDGTILGEGLGIVVIKRLADAERDGDRIYAVIRGIGSSSDGKGDAIYAPSAEGQQKAIRDAYLRAGVTPDGIGLVEAHGTGTKVGDAVEVTALRKVFGEADAPWCALGSVKSQIGHTKAAAGAAGLIKAALALHNKVIPPTIKVTTPLEEVTAGRTPFYLPGEKRPWLQHRGEPRRAAVSAFGFGGSNFHAVLEEYRPTREAVDWDGNVQIVALSGRSAAEVEEALTGVPVNGPWNRLRSMAAASRSTFTVDAPCRLLLVIERERTNLTFLLANARAMLRKSPQAPWQTPDGAFFACGGAPGKVGFIFPGQGSQYTGMLRDLACHFPAMLSAIALADDGFREGDDTRLSDLIYPPTAFSKEEQEAALRATGAAQPAIGAVSLGALRVLEGFGIAPDAVAGHSYGELTALCAAGRLGEKEFTEISRLRGRLMGEGGGDKGGMLAIPAPLALVEEVISAEKLDLVIANRNAPNQAVLSGSTEEIEKAAAIFAGRNLAGKRLPVAAAFHSPLVAEAALPLLAALEKIDFPAGRIPVYANSSALPYPNEPAAAKELLAGQLARPVEFVAEIEAMYAAGIRTFVEVGPGARLAGLVRAILGDREHTALSLDASAGKRPGISDLARALSQLAILGHGVRLVIWDEGYREPVQGNGRKPAMSIPICGANYFKPRPKRPPTPPAKKAVAAGIYAPSAPPAAPVSPATDEVSAPAVSPSPAPASREALGEALRVTRDSLSLLQKMQEETAQLHRRFLEGQEAAGRQFQLLLEQQQRILRGGHTVAPLSIPVAAPVTASVAAAPTVVPAPAPAAVPVMVQASARPAAPAAPPATAGTGGDVTAALLAVVSEKTGYPAEMLDLDMGLDADLGIDSIKRVEILSALQERLPGAPAIGPEHLGTLATLGEIARHLGAEAPSAATTAAGGPGTETEFHCPSPAETIPAVSRIRRSGVVPVPLAEEGTGVAVAASAEFWVTDDGSPLAVELASQLRDRGLTVRPVAVHDAEKIIPSERLGGLVVIAPAAGTNDRFLENAFLLLKGAAPALRRAAADGGALFATVARLDGAFGCGSATAIVDPLSGGLAGLAKTAGREWPDVTCKAIDLGGFSDDAAEALAVAVELFSAAPAEVGLTPAGRVTLALAELPAPSPTGSPIAEGEVVVVTGGGKGVTAAAAISLATAYRPFLVLLGRSPEPLPEPEWLAPLTDESRIKRALIEDAGGKLHPREIEERYRGVIANRELQGTLDRIAAVGGKAVYRSVDIRDANAITILLAEVRREHGPIRGIVHGAGVLADRLITDKSREQFARVYGTKVAGLRALLDATAGDGLRFLTLFSSTTGRFGRAGQAAYAVANEVLNKLAQAEARKRPSCRVSSINWGPWDGGMVTSSLKKVFAGEGIGLIDLTEGGEFLVREIAAADTAVEVVALAAGPAEAETLPAPASSPLTEALGLTLSVAEYPFLRSHVLDGKAVLPMAVIVEWLAHGALHGNPGFRFHGFNDLRICKGVVFDQRTPCDLKIMAGKAVKRESFYLVPVELTSTTSDGRSLLHARAEIVLATRLPEGIRSITELPTTPYVPHNGRLYDRERLFHGPDLHGIEKVDGCSAAGIAAAVKAAPLPAAWIKHPLRSSWLTDPLVMDSAFQLMILWSFERFGAGSLPCFAGRYRQFNETFPREGVQVVIRVTAEREHGATADMEFLDRHTGKLVARLEGYECIIDPSLERAFQRNRLPEPGRVELGAA